MPAIELFCCYPACAPDSCATWGFSVGPTPDDISYACDRHLGEMLPAGASSHHATEIKVEIWGLVDGYDPTTCTLEEIETAKGGARWAS